MTKLSTSPLKGMRDFYPADQFVQDYIFQGMSETARRFGYEHYDGPLLEATELYAAKSGQELVNEQTYTFVDRGERSLTMRPEMTPTLARMVAAKRNELAFPLRWYSIPNLFRYERPQRGRVREHWQLNVDIFGLDSLDADVEIIEVAHSVMTNFGADPKRFEIHVNNRKLVNFFLYTSLSLSNEDGYKLSKLIDRRSKLPAETFESACREILGSRYSELLKFLEANSIEDLHESLRNHEAADDLAQVLKRLNNSGIQNARFEPSLMRGFDYYTSTVFELFDTHPENRRALFGGGRYDDLVGLFGVEKIAGVGFGMGDVTMRDFLETYDLMPAYKSSTDLFIGVLGDQAVEYALNLARFLRGQGVNTATDTTLRKAKAQMKAADRLSIPFALFVGEQEVETQRFKVKVLTEHKEVELTRNEIAKFVLSSRTDHASGIKKQC
ncbi:MAG: histidine--tRNA ligase [Bdellovibrionales bacterium]|nr:histidine--tRNA ligase [Bdellovibrionales bacterium]